MNIKKVTIEIDPDVPVIEFFKQVEELRKNNEVDYKYLGGVLLLKVTHINFKKICKDCGVNYFNNKEEYLKWLSDQNKVRDLKYKQDKGYKWIKKKLKKD